MLVLTRKNRESVVIGRQEDFGVLLEITVLEIDGGRVRLGFQCDKTTSIHRREVWERICDGNGHESGLAEPVPMRAVAMSKGVRR